MTSSVPSSPIQPDIVRRLLTNLNANVSVSDVQTSPLRLTTVELHEIATHIQTQRATIASLTPIPRTTTNTPTTPSQGFILRPSRQPDYYNNAKFEDLATRPLKPTYDGSPDQLVPFLNRLDIRRHDEGWYPITFVTIRNKKLDLLRDFTQISATDIRQQAKNRWDSLTMEIDKHTVDHPTYNARILAKLLFGSIGDDFSLMILHRVPETYRNDGPYVLWTICNHIHRNNIAFNETIKQRIRDSTLVQFDNDVLKYIISVRDNLRLITTSSKQDNHNDLLIYIFRELTTCSIEPFKQAVQRWHVEYLEAKTPDLTPTTLLEQADTKVQILQHAGQWTKSLNPEVMALQLELQAQREQSAFLVKQLTAHVTRLVDNKGYKRQNGAFKHTRNGQRIGGTHPTWMTIPPTYPTETKIQDNRLYTWCTKCRNGQGLWVCRHNTETHVDGFQQDRDAKRRNEMVNHGQQTGLQHQGTPSNGPPQRSLLTSPPFQGQLSFFDYLENYLPEEPQDDHEVPLADANT